MEEATNQPEKETKRARPRSSKAWEYFKLSSKHSNVVICTICRMEMAYHSSTSAMMEHIKRKHPTVSLNDDGRKRTKQTSVENYLLKRSNTDPCTPQKADELSQSILKMIVKDMRPVAIVEGEGFREMTHTFHPGYTLPSRRHFTDLMEKKYEATLQSVKNKIKNTTSKITLTTDAWTSIATEAYLGVTCHFVTEDWKMSSYCLTTMPLEERHTAENIAHWIEEVAEKFGFSLRDNVLAIVHDNAANVVAALRILKERHGVSSHRCAGHTLQLIVNSALKKDPKITKALGASRSLVEHFKKSELASTKLKLKQKQWGTDEKKLIQDVPVRWNSSYYMIQRLLEQRWPVTATLSDPEVTQRAKHYLDLKGDQWSLLEDLQNALEPFEQATVFLSGEGYATVSVLLPLVKGLQKSTQTAFESAPVNSFQTAAAEEIASRWESETTFKDAGQNVCIIATALDPRFRKLKALTSEDILKVKIKLQSLGLTAKTHVREEHQQEDSPRAQSEDPKQRPKPVLSVLDTLLGSDESEDNSSDENGLGQQEIDETVRNEILMYFGEKPIPRDKNPLMWWKENEAKFPTLALLAKSYLAIPATSTPSERLFSAAGNIVTKKRASLTSKHVDMLTFLHANA